MRSLIASASIAIACLFAVPNAEAMTASANLATAINNASPIQDVAYGCRRVWRCGPYGCGWRSYCRGYGYGPRYRHGYESPTAHACGPGWSVQGGVCKPYRGY
jgi:hypothetical protein